MIETTVKPRARRRHVALGFACLLLPGCLTVTDPFDYLINAGTFGHDPALETGVDGVRRVVVLRHGLFRSAASMWKLERALRDHGYETLNQSYGSTRDHIEDHASRLAWQLDAFLGATADPRPVRLMFVGHSMGGLQIRAMLSRSGAPRPDACVFIGTPHRGAVLTDKRKDWWLFKVLMGEEGALQLSPGHPIYRRLGPTRGDCGVIYGGYANGRGNNEDVPGDDDGTVAADEAQLPEALDSVRLPLGHTWLAIDDTAIHQVLWFLKHRRFDHSR